MKTFIISLICLFSFSAAKAQAGTTTFPVTVYFGSIGTGIPSDKPLKDFITCFKKGCKVKQVIAYHIGPLGREGEYKMAFPLTGMNKAQKESFISQLKDVVPKMNERGHADLAENDTIDMSKLGRATSTKEIL